MKIKKFIPVMVLVIFLPVILSFGWSWYQNMPTKIYFHKSGTNTPVASKYLELFYYPYCNSSPCLAPQDSFLIYAGSTDQDGSILIPRHRAADVNKYSSSYVGNDSFEYWVNMEGFKRPYYTSEFRGSNIIYLDEVEGHKPYKVENGHLIYNDQENL